MNKPIGYDEWKEEAGGACEIGSQMILSDMLLGKANIHEILKKVGDMLGATFARALFSTYKLTNDFKLVRERDESLKAFDEFKDMKGKELY